MAWAYVDGANSKSWRPSGASVDRYVKARLYYQITETETTYKVDVYGQGSVGNDNLSETIHGTLSMTDTSGASGQKTYTYSSNGTNHTNVFYNICKSASAPLTHTWTKTTSSQEKRATMKITRHGFESSIYSNATKVFSIPAKKQYTVTANGNGGETTVPSDWTDSDKNATKTDYYGTSITLPGASRAGYTFLGWSTSSTATSATYSEGASYTITANITLYAIWKVNSYTLTANANSGSISSTSDWSGTGSTATKTLNYNTAYGTLPTPTRTGYTFNGWYTAASGGSAVNNNTTMGAGNSTIYAHWTAISYTITYTLNGGSASNPTSYTIETASFTLTNPTRTGYNFSGWTGSNGNTASTSVTITKGSTGNKSYTANWTEKTATLTYNKAGLSSATIPANVTMKYTAATSLTAGTPPSGYNFYGWATSEANAKAGTRAYTGTATYKNANVVPTAAMLYAIWYGTLSYNANGHGTAPTAQTMYYTAATNTAAAISATGYTFGGWNTASNGSGTSYQGNKEIKAASAYKANTTLYAQWTANTYTLTINPQSGSYNSTTSNSTKTMTYNSTNNNDIGIPTRSGYTFGGWYTSTNGGGTLVFSNAGDYNNSATTYWNSGKWIYTNALTVYAKWTANDYKVTFNANGGTTPTASKTVTYAETYGTLPTPTRANHTFAGWYTAASGGSAITSSSTFSTAGNVTLYAHWTGNKVGPKFVNTPLTQRATSAGVYNGEDQYCIVVIKANSGYSYANTSDTITKASTTLKVEYQTGSNSYTTAYLKKIGTSTTTTAPTITDNEETTFLITNSSGTGIKFNTLTVYNIRFTLTSSSIGLSSSPIVIPLSAAIFPIDFNADGTAAGLFRVAPDDDEGLFIGKKVNFESTVNNLERASTSVTWVNGRTGALVHNSISDVFTSNRYNPIVSVKSIDGSWDMGTHTANNSLYFTYILDTNFNAGTNTTTQQIEFRGSTGYIRANGFHGDGSELTNISASNISSGTLAVARGGTGKTTAKDAANTFIDALDTASADWTDKTLVLTSDANGDTNLYYRRPATNAWNYIKTKTDATYLKLTGGTVTGATTMNSTLQVKNILTLYREGTTEKNYPAGLNFSVKDTTTGQTYSSAYIYAYQDHAATTAGVNLVIRPGGSLFIGGGESPSAHYAEKGSTYNGEHAFITADSAVYIQGGGNTVANRVGFYVNGSQQLIPCKADVATNNVGSIGTSSYKWNAMYATTFYGSLSGTASTATTVSYTTTAPTAANSSGLKFAVLSSSPSTKYSGWVYLIKE